MTCGAGSAVVINQKVFHGNYPNFSDCNRRMLAIAYRPAWAGPVMEVDSWSETQTKFLPPETRRFFRDPNTRRIDYDVPNRPNDMDRSCAGIAPSRWSVVE